MRYDTVDKFDSRYVAVAPMPSLLDAIEGACDALKAAEYCMTNVRGECVEAIAYAGEVSEKYKSGELDGWDETDLAKCQGEERLARRILEALGYEIAYYFCGTPILKRVEAEEEQDA